MSEIVTTNISFFEVGIELTKPNIKIWLDRVAIVEAVYAALRPWNITVDDIEVIQTGKPSEQGVKFKLPERRASFFFGAAACHFTRDSTNWQTAEETIRILDAALRAFHANTDAEVAVFKTAVALHVQLTTKPFDELLRPLIPTSLARLENAPPKSMATIVKWPDRRVTIDASAQIANGIFIRYERDFEGNATYDHMAKRLQADEEQVFAMLDIREE